MLPNIRIRICIRTVKVYLASLQIPTQIARFERLGSKLLGGELGAVRAPSALLPARMGSFKESCDSCGGDATFRNYAVCQACEDKRCTRCWDRHFCEKCGMNLCRHCCKEHAEEHAEIERRAQCVAFAMGDHARLGAGSRVRWLDVGVVRMVLEYMIEDDESGSTNKGGCWG